VEALLFEVRATDAPTLLAVAITLVLLGGASTLVPALRALRIDPAEALRAD
jgi:ABC-type antimicrobial peptide transport system permease subunit